MRWVLSSTALIQSDIELCKNISIRRSVVDIVFKGKLNWVVLLSKIRTIVNDDTNLRWSISILKFLLISKVCTRRRSRALWVILFDSLSIWEVTAKKLILMGKRKWQWYFLKLKLMKKLTTTIVALKKHSKGDVNLSVFRRGYLKRTINWIRKDLCKKYYVYGQMINMRYLKNNGRAISLYIDGRIKIVI